MNIKDATFKRLAGIAAVTAIAGQRIYRKQADQGAVLPYLVYNRMGGAPGYSLDGPNGLGQCRMLIEIYAATDVQAEQIAALIRAELHGDQSVWGGVGGVEVQACFLLDDRDEVTPSPGASGNASTGVTLEFQINYTEGA